MQYYYECSYSIVGINDLPVELIDEVAKYQTQDELYRNLRVCKAWLPSFERRLYMCPRVSSEAGMQKLLRALALPRLNFRRSILSLNIRGKANYSSFTPTTWVLSMPETLGKHFPALQSLTFESLEGVSLTTNFWSAMGSVSMQIMELRIVRSRLGREDAEKLMITFPNLRYLSLTNVRWAPKKDKRFSVRLRDWVKRSVPIERLELADMDREELLDVLPWAVYSSLETLHDLELQRVGVRDLHKLIPYIAQLRLHSLALTPLVPNGTHPGFLSEFCEALQNQASLKRLHLGLHTLDPELLKWVPRMLDYLTELPLLAEVKLEFTFDSLSMGSEFDAWADIREGLTTKWRHTLRRVTLVHHPVGNFPGMNDENVIWTLQKRFWELKERGILEVQIGVRYG